MAISFCILGSGSRGNCTLLCLRAGDTTRYLLVDCGLSPRQTKLRLKQVGVPLERISAILLTHVDADHFNANWSRTIHGRDMTVHVHRRHRHRVLACGLDGRNLAMFDGPFSPADGVDVEPVMLPHDELGTVGYRVDHAGARLGFATDLGSVPERLLERFVGLHALAIESNYDRDLELASPRPSFLKQRVMGHAGHLSNEQALEAVLRIDERSSLAHVVLLHLSQHCNHPRLIEQLYAERSPALLERLTISGQDRPTGWLEVPGVASTAACRAAT